MDTAGETLATAAALAQIRLVMFARLVIGRPPDGMLIERDGPTIFSPIASMLMLGVVLSLFVEVVRRP